MDLFLSQILKGIFFEYTNGITVIEYWERPPKGPFLCHGCC